MSVMCESECDNVSLNSRDCEIYNQWCTRVIDVVPRFMRVMQEHNVAVPMAGYFENQEEFWPMHADKAPESLLQAEYIVVFAKSIGERRGDTVNTFRFKNSQSEWDNKTLRDLPMRVHFVSYAAFEQLWTNAPPLQTYGMQTVRCRFTRPCATLGAAVILEEPRFDAQPVACFHPTNYVRVGDAACRSAKQGKHEVYVYVVEPAEGWVSVAQLPEVRVNFAK